LDSLQRSEQRFDLSRRQTGHHAFFPRYERRAQFGDECGAGRREFNENAPTIVRMRDATD
jgi:hypothetical protein